MSDLELFAGHGLESEGSELDEPMSPVIPLLSGTATNHTALHKKEVSTSTPARKKREKKALYGKKRAQNQ